MGLYKYATTELAIHIRMQMSMLFLYSLAIVTK